SDLEACLARADESVLGLQARVSRRSKDQVECEHRAAETGHLQVQLAELSVVGDIWWADLEAREVRVQELE
ncbi:hypothetical protein B0H10DRAFT_1753221, partial [Mycena sp. CBHHK59/15]